MKSCRVLGCEKKESGVGAREKNKNSTLVTFTLDVAYT